MKSFLVTGGVGIIGSAVVRPLGARRRKRGVTLDKLTHAGDPAFPKVIDNVPDHVLVEGDIANSNLVLRLLREHAVGGSCTSPLKGPFRLLSTALECWRGLGSAGKENFRCNHVFAASPPSSPSCFLTDMHVVCRTAKHGRSGVSCIDAGPRATLCEHDPPMTDTLSQPTLVGGHKLSGLRRLTGPHVLWPSIARPPYDPSTTNRRR